MPPRPRLSWWGPSAKLRVTEGRTQPRGPIYTLMPPRWRLPWWGPSAKSFGLPKGNPAPWPNIYLDAAQVAFSLVAPSAKSFGLPKGEPCRPGRVFPGRGHQQRASGYRRVNPAPWPNIYLDAAHRAARRAISKEHRVTDG